jgi:hypothetical protein
MPPLHNPGQSLGDQLTDLIYGKMVMWWVVAVLGIVFAVHEWLRWWLTSPPQPVVATGLAAVLVGLAAWRVVKIWPEARRVSLGLKGEKVVGQCLEQLRATGYQVFHDIPGDGYNVDHVLVGPGGVFAVETKTRMKPRGRESKVVFDGETVTVDGFSPDRDPVVQVQAAARQVKEIIRQTTGLDIHVRPVVLYPGWFTRSARGVDVWVLNETAFPKWVQAENRSLDDAAVRQIAAGIAMHVRNGG